LYGEQFFESTEFSDLGVVNLSDPTNPIFLTSDGLANTFAWSPDSLWIAYKHMDVNGVPQLFRASPDGKNIEQLTFHTERLGIGYMVWSPNGRYIAYAGYQSKNEGETGIGWVDIVDTHTLGLFRALPTEDDFGGVRQNELWWSLDGAQLVFSGRDWQDSAAATQIYWVNVQDRSIADSYFASDAPGETIDEVYAVGDVNHILFSSNGNFYLLNENDKSYQQFPFNLNSIGQQYESESAPFDFPGEVNCLTAQK
jgi:Tol biopolymer transport system component